jgi:chromosome partitioning protein
MTATTETTETSETSKGRPPTVSMLNQKGGVGKTTLTVQLAGALSARGLDVLCIDLATEGALTSILGFDDEYSSARDVTLAEILLDPQSNLDSVADLIRETPEFDLLPSHERMAAKNLSKTLEDEPRARDRLGMVLESVSDYDIVLVDNEPSINVLTDNGIVNSDGVLIPTYAEALSVQGLDRLQKQIESIENYFGPVEILGLVVNRIEDNNQADAMVSRLEETFGESLPVWKIRKRVALQRSLAKSQQSTFGVSEQCDMAEVLEQIAAQVESDVGVDDV